MSECNIDGLSLSELINHDPSPIQGVQFLSQSPRAVDEGMRQFANKARTDILQGWTTRHVQRVYTMYLDTRVYFTLCQLAWELERNSPCLSLRTDFSIRIYMLSM